jgi:hypothetical protein
MLRTSLLVPVDKTQCLSENPEERECLPLEDVTKGVVNIYYSED